MTTGITVALYILAATVVWLLLGIVTLPLAIAVVRRAQRNLSCAWQRGPGRDIGPHGDLSEGR